MKKLTVFFALFLATLTVIAQNPRCRGKRYDHKLKDSVECRMPAGASGYCHFHDPATPHCGAMTSKGHPCRQIVAKPGDRCRFHQDRTARIRGSNYYEEIV
jgi:hypothetical protein